MTTEHQPGSPPMDLDELDRVMSAYLEALIAWFTAQVTEEALLGVVLDGQTGLRWFAWGCPECQQ